MSVPCVVLYTVHVFCCLYLYTLYIIFFTLLTLIVIAFSSSVCAYSKSSLSILYDHNYLLLCILFLTLIACKHACFKLDSDLASPSEQRKQNAPGHLKNFYIELNEKINLSNLVTKNKMYIIIIEPSLRYLSSWSVALKINNIGTITLEHFTPEPFF